MKKAFTLVEMLAVIIILAIVSLVAIPVVSGIVDEVKLGAFKRNVENIEDIISRKVAIDSLKGNNSEKSYVYADGKSTSGDLDRAFKGKRPDEAIIHVNTSGEIEYVIYDKALKACASKSYSSSTYKLINNVSDKSGCLGKLEIVLFTNKSLIAISGLSDYASEIQNIRFVDNYEAPAEALSYDLSLAKNGSVTGYLVKTGEYEDHNTYDLYVYSLSKIYTSTSFNFFNAGEYLSITGESQMPRLEMIDLENLNTINTVSMYHLFNCCISLKEIKNIQNLNTSNVTNMSYMFNFCESLIALDLSKFDTSKVREMNNMFQNCKSLTTLDLRSFDTSNVTSMVGMFSLCESLTSLNLSSFNTSNVKSMYAMFGYCKSLTTLDLSSFDTSNVTEMTYMFNTCESLKALDLSKFDTSKVKRMYSMFGSCLSLATLNLGNFNTVSLTDMGYMFFLCRSLITLDLSGFDVSKVTSMKSLFNGTSKLNVIYVNNNWNIEHVSDVTDMFKGSKTNHVTVKS